MIEKIFKHASASEACDYYQVSFDDDDDTEGIDGRYLLIQRQFEFADGRLLLFGKRRPQVLRPRQRKSGRSEQ